MACKITRCLAFFSSYLAQNQVAIFYIDRLLLMTKYQWYSNTLMHNRSYCITLFIINILLSAGLSSPNLVQFSYNPDLERCFVQDSSVISQYTFQIVAMGAFFYLLVPLVVAIPANCFVAYKLRSDGYMYTYISYRKCC